MASPDECETIRYTTGEASPGVILVAVSEAGVVALTMGDTVADLVVDLAARFPGVILVRDDDALAEHLRAAVAVLDDPTATFPFPLDARGTEFRRRVWQELREVPAGTTVTYGELAERVGRPAAVRAVASACASNPLAVVVPCHRVVRADGSLGGYRWGLQRKRALLDRER